MGFLIVGIVGASVLLISFLVDGFLESMDLDFLDTGIFSTTTIATFMGTFGFVGYLASKMGWANVPTFAVSIISGLVVAGLIVALIKLFKRSEQESGTYGVDKLVGKQGRVLMSNPVNGYGTVAIEFNGSKEHYSMKCDTTLIPGDLIVVDEILSPTSVKVKKLAIHQTFDTSF